MKEYSILILPALASVMIAACSVQGDSAERGDSINAASPAGNVPSAADTAGPRTDTALPDTTSPLRTSAATYMIRKVEYGYATEIPYTYTNRSGDSVYLINCNGDVSPGLERRSDDIWESAWVPVMNQCLSPAIVIPPGGTYSDTLRMVVQSHDRDFFNEIESPGNGGEYRLIWHQAAGSFDASARPFGAELPREQRVSNAFTLTR